MNKNPKCKIIGDNVIIRVGQFKNGKIKYISAKIVQMSQTGIYCNNDEFYGWEMF